MAIIETILEPKEKLIWKGYPHYGAWMCSAVLAALVLVGMAAVFLIVAQSLWSIPLALAAVALVIYSQLSYGVTAYALTNKRIILQSGVIGRDFRSLDYDQVKNASVKVGILGLIFHVGHVLMFSGEMMSVGSGNNSSIQPKYDSFNYIRKPYEVLKILQQHLSHRKETLYSGKAK